MAESAAHFSAIGAQGNYHGRMAVVLQFFWHVCLLRLSPEIAPKHPLIALMVLAGNLAVSIFASAVVTGGALLQLATGILVSTATLVGLVRLACLLRGLGARFMQTIVTILGCDLVLTAILAVLVPILGLLHESGVAAAYLVFAIWSLTVFGFILSKALDLQRVLGVGFALTIMFASAGLASWASAE